jgi:hypothetical protein
MQQVVVAGGDGMAKKLDIMRLTALNDDDLPLLVVLLEVWF